MTTEPTQRLSELVGNVDIAATYPQFIKQDWDESELGHLPDMEEIKKTPPHILKAMLYSLTLQQGLDAGVFIQGDR